MQKGCHEGLCIEPPATADLCNGKGVGNVRLARLATLPEVGFIREPKGLCESSGIGRL
jgi:hypothetical protein